MAAPFLVAGLIAAICIAPLRWSMIALLFLGLTLEAPYEAFAAYAYHTPWSVGGTAFLGHLNLVPRIGALKFTGFDLMVVLLTVVHGVRRARSDMRDAGG